MIGALRREDGRVRSLRLILHRAPGALATMIAVPALSFAFWTVQVDGPWQIPGAGHAHVLSRLDTYLRATFLHLDLGTSSSLGAGPVKRIVMQGLPVDLMLLTGGVVLGVVLGLAGGLRGTGTVRGATLIAISTPVFVSGLIVLELFSRTSGRVPVPFVSGQGEYVGPGADLLGWLRAVWVPCLILAAPIAALCARVVDRGLRETLHEDYIAGARARGVAERTILTRHALRPVAAGVASMVGARMALIVLDLALVEVVFNLPGSFREIIDAVTRLDLPLVQGMVLVSTALVVSGGLAAELAALWIDPIVEP
jgi:peptide/nickel transport system permease protein